MAGVLLAADSPVAVGADEAPVIQTLAPLKLGILFQTFAFIDLFGGVTNYQNKRLPLWLGATTWSSRARQAMAGSVLF
jgi:hypothetical protein